MKNLTFEQWTGGAKESEIEEMKKNCAKSRNRYFLIWVISYIIGMSVNQLAGVILDKFSANIPDSALMFIGYAGILFILFVGGIFCGLGIFAGNTLAFLRTRGRNTGNGAVRLVLLLLGGVLIPIIVVQLCARSNSFSNKICGVK